MPAITFKRELTIGTVVQLVGLAATAILFWDRIDSRQKQLIDEAEKSRLRLERVERYLSSKDSRYWEIIREMSFDFDRKKEEESQPNGSHLSRTAALGKLQTQ